MFPTRRTWLSSTCSRSCPCASTTSGTRRKPCPDLQSRRPRLGKSRDDGRAMAMLPRARCLDLLVSSYSLGIEQLKRIHAQMIASGLLRRRGIAMGRLIERYSAVSAPVGMDYARLVFRHAGDDGEGEQLPTDAVFAWNVMIRCSSPEESLLLYARHQSGRGGGRVLVPDDHTFTYVLGACARSLALREGKQIHAQILKTRSASALDVAVGTTTIHFYASCGDVESAWQLFDDMPERSCATWNAMMTGYCLNNQSAGKAVLLFREMLLLGKDTRPTDRTAVAVLSACSQLGELALGSSVHAYICKAIPFEDDVFVGTALVDMYSKCGCMDGALRAFDRTKEKNVLTWTAMMAGLAIHGKGKAALEMLEAMMRDTVIVPNAVTFTCLLSACCHARLVEEGLQLFRMMSSRFGIAPRIQHYGCIVDLLGRAGMVEEACSFVKGMPVEPDAILWRTLLGACKIHGLVKLGEEVGKNLLHQEQSSSELPVAAAPSCEDHIALSNVYASAGRWEDVWKLREAMKDMGIQNKPGRSLIQLNNLDSVTGKSWRTRT